MPTFLAPLPPQLQSLLFVSTPDARAPYDPAPLLPGQVSFDAPYLKASEKVPGVPSALPNDLGNFLAFNGIDLQPLPVLTSLKLPPPAPGGMAFSRVVGSYIPLDPFTQYRGVGRYDIVDEFGISISGYWVERLQPVSIFALDAQNVAFQIWDYPLAGFRNYDEFLYDPLVPQVPTFTEPVLSPAGQNQIAFDMAQSLLFKDKVAYLIVGDEVRGNLSGTATGVMNLQTLMTDSDFTSFKSYLTFMPRANLWQFFMTQIYPGIPMAGAVGDIREGTQVTDPTYGTVYIYKSYQDLVWAAVIDVFNQANAEYMAKTGLSDPWAWETQKTNAFYTTQNQTVMDNLRQQFQDFSDVGLALDPLAKPIMDEYATLPPLGDTGLEINRENAIKELLKSKEYVVAQAIVDAYRYAQDTIIGPALANPIPMDVIGQDGTVLLHKT